MTCRAFFTPAARQDLLNARDWYEQQREGLGFQFVDELQLATERIESNPEQFAIVYREVRLCPVKRFPYLIVFRILDDAIEVLAIIHAHRDPDAWKQRR